MKFLTIDDFDLKGKTVFLRVDMNCPIDPETLEISGTKRIEEIVETINSPVSYTHLTLPTIYSV